MGWECFEFVIAGQGHGRKFYGGVGVRLRKGRSQFHVAVSNVTTEINSSEKVWIFFVLLFNLDF